SAWRNADATPFDGVSVTEASRFSRRAAASRAAAAGRAAAFSIEAERSIFAARAERKERRPTAPNARESPTAIRARRRRIAPGRLGGWYPALSSRFSVCSCPFHESGSDG